MTNKTESAHRLAIVLISALIAACTATNGADGSGSGEPTYARAVVTGDVDALKAFATNLTNAVGGDAKLEANLIGCKEGCDKLADDSATQLVYYLSRERLSLFGEVWDTTETQTAGGVKDLSVTIDPKIVPHDCPVKPSPPLPNKCQPIPACVDNGCGRLAAPISCSYC